MGLSYPSHELLRQTCDSERLWVESAKQPGKIETLRPIKRRKKKNTKSANTGKRFEEVVFRSRSAAARCRKTCRLISP